MTAPLQRSKKKLWVQPPRTAMEVYSLLPEGTRCEVIDNTLYMPPSPSYEHQEYSMSLSSRMRVFADDGELGKLLGAPLDVFLDDNTVCQPDIFFIGKRNMGIIQSSKIKGVPDLVIEMVSPGNRKHDLQTKFELYERFGVQEYFIIDPFTKEVLHYLLQDKKYQQQPVTKGRIVSKVLGTSFSF